MTEFYIGLMTGTSCDGIDATLVEFDSLSIKNLNSIHRSMPESLRKNIFNLMTADSINVDLLYSTDAVLGKSYAKIVKDLIHSSGKSPKEITAIGCHGQTIRHKPNNPIPYTVQIGDPNIVASDTGITTVTDFRRKDIAQGGQGAPLTPAFHEIVFRGENCFRSIVNIGGMSNVTFLAPNQDLSPTHGYDVGPGNCLIDYTMKKYFDRDYDDNGRVAAQGLLSQDLLHRVLQDPYFHQPPPKSTGREYFNAAWLERYLQSAHPLEPVNLITTVTEITAQTISYAILAECSKYTSNFSAEIYLCGGGAYNLHLQQRISTLTKLPVYSTAELGISPENVETTAFAWLAKQCIHKIPINLASITGTSKQNILGGIYYP